MRRRRRRPTSFSRSPNWGRCPSSSGPRWPGCAPRWSSSAAAAARRARLKTTEAAAQLLSAAKGLEDLDDDLARETYLEALTAAMYAGRLGEPGRLAEIADAARAAVDRVPELQRPIDFLLSGMTSRILDGPGAGSDHLRSALELWNDHAQRGDGQPAVWPFPIAQESAAHELWDDAVLQQIATDMVRRARDTGALAVLPPALAYRAGVHVYTGEFATAARLHRRGRRDHRVDGPHAGEVPLVESRGVAGRSRRRGRT